MAAHAAPTGHDGDRRGMRKSRDDSQAGAANRAVQQREVVVVVVGRGQRAAEGRAAVCAA